MCAVSVISQYGRDRIPRDTWTPGTWAHYQELLRKAAEFDREHNQPDCDTEDKTAWQAEVEKRLAALESSGASTPREA